MSCVPELIQALRTILPAGGVADSASLATGSAPAAVSDLAATPASTSVALAWTHPAGTTATVYRLDVTAAGAFVSVATGVTGSPYNDTGRPSENAYQYKITLTNEFGTSADSNVVDTTTTAAPAASREIYINFESGTAITPLTTWGTDTVAVVTNDPYAGTQCIRGNLASGLAGNDPITGKGRNNSPINLDVAGLTSNANRSWGKVFMRYRMRFDDADNRQDNDTQSTPKLGYISDTSLTFETGCAIWPVIEPVKGLRSIYKNSNGDSFDPLPEFNAGAPQGECTGCDFAYDGSWDLVEMLYDHVNHTHEYWINGIKFVGPAAPDGIWPMAEQFRFDHYRFFHGNDNVWSLSVNGTEEKGGFQLDEIEVWNGDPRV